MMTKQEIKEVIAKNVAEEFEDGWLVNLGAGIPTHVANHIPDDKLVMTHVEAGLIGCGPLAERGHYDYTLVDASTRPTTKTYDAVCFESPMSFGIIRGGHLDVTVLGALQVDQEGSMANWIIPGKSLQGVGGAMDLCVGAKKVIVAMEHTTKDGKSKIVKKCDMPLTCFKEVNTIITELAILDVTDHGLQLRALAPGISAEEVQKKTEAEIIIPETIQHMVELQED